MRPRRRFLACTAGTLTNLLVWAAPGQAQVPAPAVPTVASVDSIFARFDSTTTPGCAVAVLRGDEVILRKSYGMANLSLGVPMTSATSFWIPYSEARVFTALAVAMLVRDGRITLDDTIRQHIPEVPGYAAAVTLRHLLHHTSGLADYGALAGPGWDLPDRTSEDEFFRIITRWGRLGFAPGTDHMYSNTDYALLKILVERVTGGSLHAYLDARLFTPLGMASTRIGADQSAVFPGHTVFYEPIGGVWTALLRYRVSPVGGISVTTSADDLIRWARALRNPVLGLDSMLTSLEVGAPEGEEGFAFGVYPINEAQEGMVTYRGVGEYIYLVRVPAAELSVITLCNAYRGMWVYGPAVTRLYTGGEVSAQAVAPPSPASIAPVVVPRSELERYRGEYRPREGGSPDQSFQIATADGGLEFTGPDGRRFLAQPIGDGRFEFDVTPPGIRIRLAFAMESDGELAMQITENGKIYSPPLYPWTPWIPTAEDLRPLVGTYTGDDVEATFYVTIEGDRLMMAGHGMAAIELAPQDEPDLFRIPDYEVRFHRDASGRVSHLMLNTTRVKGMRFSRQP